MHARMIAEEQGLAGVGAALHELHDGGGLAVAERARQHAEGSGGFTFAATGMQDHHPRA